MTAKPTTITAAEFIDNGYAARIAARECVVKSILYTKFEVVSVEQIKPNSDGWDVAITDTKSTYRTWSNAKLTVTWLPQQADSGATVEAGDDDLLIDERVTSPISKDSIPVVIVDQKQWNALRADLASAKAEAGRLRAALEAIANKSDPEKPIRLDGETGTSYGRTYGQWEMAKIAREALQAGTEGG